MSRTGQAFGAQRLSGNLIAPGISTDEALSEGPKGWESRAREEGGKRPLESGLWTRVLALAFLIDSLVLLQ